MNYYIKNYAVLLYHEDFICRYLRKYSYCLNDGSRVYCKDSTRFWKLLEKVRARINDILREYPDAGKIFLHEELWYNAVR